MNSKIKVFVIDDEKDGRDYVSLLLHNEFPDLEILFSAAGIEEAYPALVKQSPDILFIDIQLADGNAFELLERITKLPSQIIFITAYEKYAIKAIRQGATDYLLKPVNKTEFIVAVNKAIENIQAKKLLALKTQPGKINLPTLHGFKRVMVEDIVRCEADSNYTLFYLLDSTKIIVSKTMQEFEEFLLGFNFFRIHHKHLINLQHLKEYIKGKGGQVVMADNSVIDVSARKKSEFMKRITQEE